MYNTRGIVLRSVKYGESSLITTLFTDVYGIQSFMMQGVRTSKPGKNKTPMLQPAMLLEIVLNYQPLKTLQRMKECQPAYLYQTVHADIIKNSVALFSVEILFRLLPEHAPQPDLFDFVFDYFVMLDKATQHQSANYALYFTIMVSRHMGFELTGDYSPATLYLNLQEGGYTPHPPAAAPFMTDEEGAVLSRVLRANDYEGLEKVSMNAAMRARLLQWYISFLQAHTQHMGNIKSLAVLQAILH